MSIIDKQNKLRRISEDLRSGNLSEKDKTFLCDALNRIASGEDAKKALDVKPKRGERSSKSSHKAQKNSNIKLILALSWIATAKSPKDDGGLGLTLEEAIGLIGESGAQGGFGLTEETLKTYWTKNPDKQKLEFKLPD